MVYIRLFACFEPSSPSDVHPMCSHMHQMCGNVLLFNGTAWDGLGRAKMQNPQCLCELGRWDGHHGGSLPTPQISYQAGPFGATNLFAPNIHDRTQASE